MHQALGYCPYLIGKYILRGAEQGSEQALRALKLGEGSRKRILRGGIREEFRTSLLVIERSSGIRSKI
jgi:hypothetical protein